MARRKLPIILVAVLVAAAIGAGIVLWRSTRSEGPRPLRLYGNVDIREVALGFRQSGRLIQVRVDEGDDVEAGEVVAALDPEPLEAALASARAQAEGARARLAKLKAGNRPQEIARARDGVNQAQATFAQAETDLQRETFLRQQGANTERDLERAQERRDVAAANLAAAKQALSLQRAGARAEDVAAAEAQVAAADAAVAQAAIAVGDARLLAPSRATVLSRVREPGSMVHAGETILSLSVRDPVYVRAYVSETELGRVAPGTAVTLTIDSSAKVYHGQIGFVSPRAEFTPKTVETTELRTDLVYRLRIVCSDADEALRQGMPVTVTVPVAQKRT